MILCYSPIRRYATFFDAMLKCFSPWYVNGFFIFYINTFFVLVFYLEKEEGVEVLYGARCMCGCVHMRGYA